MQIKNKKSFWRRCTTGPTSDVLSASQKAYRNKTCTPVHICDRCPAQPACGVASRRVAVAPRRTEEPGGCKRVRADRRVASRSWPGPTSNGRRVVVRANQERRLVTRGQNHARYATTPPSPPKTPSLHSIRTLVGRRYICPTDRVCVRRVCVCKRGIWAPFAARPDQTRTNDQWPTVRGRWYTCVALLPRSSRCDPESAAYDLVPPYTKRQIHRPTPQLNRRPSTSRVCDKCCMNLSVNVNRCTTLDHPGGFAPSPWAAAVLGHHHTAAAAAVAAAASTMIQTGDHHSYGPPHHPGAPMDLHMSQAFPYYR